ncbi:transporter [Nocardia cyriacigeorgica]|uniref:glycine betaine ABC transporter substrate-binding protein n=1 Tax=Nocardia cyriacigeorgica TaxID=135487 RepID=UPI0018960E28|nr:glycine betaine ABC transporter substrate-binding protein [Nocardia cyriacigeorgica]MBF6160968.1 transporter [Nocardia cyriacigeorgica]MBF6201041.1 transporter [Nocardia cyriacigeorgica]MBF6318700.1 transporter [Nocardia cyriacigeorgica]MBF6531789.1 transporter [Nocardia cyriacigeorgica]
MVLAAPLRVLARIVVVALATVAVSCGDDPAPEPLVVGAGDSAESVLLAEIYAQALARTGAAVVVETGLGTRADRMTALDAGTVTLVGEHNGALLGELAGNATAWNTDAVTRELNRSLPQGLVVTDAADGADLRARVLVNPTALAESVTDLTPRCSSSSAGVAPVPGLLTAPPPALRIDGCDFASTQTFADPAELRKALIEGRIQVGLLAGPAELAPYAAEGLRVLSDDDNALRAENPVALVRKGTLDDREWEKLNYVAGELTTDRLTAMVAAVRDDNANPAELARTWLDDHDL